MAIRSFANNEFPLRINDDELGELNGKRYSDLDGENKQTFLEYLVPVEQLLNVPDSVVFDVFQRLNTYNYNLSSQELRPGWLPAASLSLPSAVGSDRLVSGAIAAR